MGLRVILRRLPGETRTLATSLAPLFRRVTIIARLLLNPERVREGPQYGRCGHSGPGLTRSQRPGAGRSRRG
jgi:hypothetical protein